MRLLIPVLFLSLFLDVSFASINPESLTQSLNEVTGADGLLWAVLVAGSNSYYNYRHQADVCHAYHVLKHHGIPDERIIVMMYDDIANNDLNPSKGDIRNHPHGPNVYQGVPKHYVGKDVNPDNFLRVLQGDQDLASQGFKVLKTSQKDHIFVYFSDHGAPGLIAFPDSELHARKLNGVLKKMAKNKSFSKLVFYMEACESGSMFRGILGNDENIFAMTASNERESSYACYWDDYRKAFLGDQFSVNWLEDSDQHLDLMRESIQEQFKKVRKETNQSHVMEYGDLTISRMPVGEFLGKDESLRREIILHSSKSTEEKELVPSYDVPLETASRALRSAESEEERKFWSKEFSVLIQGRDYLNQTMQRLVVDLQSVLPTLNEDIVNNMKVLNDYDCYERLTEVFSQNCFHLPTHTHSLRFLYILVNVCEILTDDESESLALDVIANHCKKSAVMSHTFTRIL